MLRKDYSTISVLISGICSEKHLQRGGMIKNRSRIDGG
jgi:hypothetical protein